MVGLSARRREGGTEIDPLRVSGTNATGLMQARSCPGIYPPFLEGFDPGMLYAPIH